MMDKTTVCRICQGTTLKEVMDFGEVALAGGFLEPGMFHMEQRHHLRIGMCTECATVQVVDAVPASTLFDHYFYRSSTSRTMRDHFAAYAADIAARYAPRHVVEIGCNDGAMLRPLAALGIEVTGVDPSDAAMEHAAGDAIVLKEYLGPDTVNACGQADVVVANNVFAHVEDIHGFTTSVRGLMRESGVFVFEVHYLGAMVETGQYDAIYHEHVFYWSLLAVETLLEKHDMMVFDVQPIKTHGGSMRFHACRKGARHALPQVIRLRNAERLRCLDWPGRIDTFAIEAKEHRQQMMGLLLRLKREGMKVAAYGASGRANTMLQWCGIGPDLIEYVVDDCPGKQGHFTPGTHIPIVSPDVLFENPPDWLLVTAWTFMEEIADRIAGYRGGLIVPFPHVQAFAPKTMEVA